MKYTVKAVPMDNPQLNMLPHTVGEVMAKSWPAAIRAAKMLCAIRRMTLDSLKPADYVPPVDGARWGYSTPKLQSN